MEKCLLIVMLFDFVNDTKEQIKGCKTTLG